MNYLQQYAAQHQGPPSEEMENTIEQLTMTQIKAEDMLVELSVDKSQKENDRDPPHAGTSSQFNALNTVHTTSRLPQLELPLFDGNVLHWHEYWSQFTACVEGRSDLSDVDKLSYLQRTVSGRAKELIAGLTTTNENYKIAVGTLMEEYGEEGILIDAHYMALFSIPKANSDIAENKRALADIDRHLRILNAMGENTSHNNALRAVIIDKFSMDVQSNLRMKLTPARETVGNIIGALKTIIKALDGTQVGTLSTTGFTPGGTSGSSFTTETLYSQAPNRRPSSISNRKRKLQPREQGQHRSQNGKHEKKRQNLDSESKQHKQRNTCFNTKQQHARPSDPQNTQESCTVKKEKEFSCIFCQGQHRHESCTQYKTLEERKAQLKGRCFCCLRKGHSATECPNSSIECVHCKRRSHHNRCLCPTICVKKETVALFSQVQVDTLLQTALAPVQDNIGRTVMAKLLFDSGSQRSYIHVSLAKKLNLPTLEKTCLTVFTFGAITPKSIQTDLVSLCIIVQGQAIEVFAYVVPYTTGLLPSNSEVKTNIRQRYHHLSWAKDTEIDTHAEVIIGNDYYFKFIMPERKEIAENLYIVNTGLGWIPSGRFINNSSTDYQLSVLTYVERGCICSTDDIFVRPDPAITRDDNIKMLWELDAIGITDSPKVVQDEEIIDYFNRTTKFIGKRYYVKWPWVEFPPILPINLGLAVGRLQSLLKRSDLQQRQQYNAVLADQLNQGIIEKLLDAELPKSHPVHYLPHHCIIQENKSTKLRIVYDASAKVRGQCSLNELLYKGPLMLEDLCTLLLRFRSHRIGVVADVEKAFLQVGLQLEDRDVTRFLWVKDINSPPTDGNLIHFRFCRVPFGVISSPFLLAATIRYHLSRKESAFASQLANCLYVDNLVTGADTLSQATDLYHTAKLSFEELSMNLRKWNSNDQSLLDALPPSQRDDNNSVSVLGLKWDTIKRVIASVFDPCGFVAPLTLPTRIFLQNLWQKGLNWDTALSPEQQESWVRCTNYLKTIPHFATQRQYTQIPAFTSSCELHCFTDASLEAYVAVIYLRMPLPSCCQVSFVISKSRVTPLKKRGNLTVPKLELLAVVIGTRLLTYVQRALGLQSINTYLWTDNQAVLGWLHTDRLLPPWVSRRVGEVHKTRTVRLRYVPSHKNPADIATRPLENPGIPAVWLDGPQFLSGPSHQWPSQHQFFPLHMEGVENTLNNNETNPCESLTSRVFLTTIPLTDMDLPSDGDVLPHSTLQELQRRYFATELSRGITNLTRALGVFVDKDGLLRCKGRYHHAELPYDQRCPILLPKESDLTSWVIRKIHENNYHVGVSHTLSLLRQHYWVPHGRQVVTKILRRCPQCVKYGGGPYRLPPMPDLPPERINYSSPFTYTGLDYLGPLLVTAHGTTKKRWVCLFTCMTVRAIHLEVVEDLSAEEFTLCFRRFISTRGPPKMVLSDNAPQFTLAASLLAAPTLHQHNVDWRFITELSPWKGGVYERLVGLVKHCLRRTLDKSLLSDSQLRTVMKEIEGVLNTRPLTTVGPDHELVLTPNHFLRVEGLPILHPPEDMPAGFPTDIQQRVVEGWKRTAMLLREFQRMFVAQYLLSLRERHSPFLKQPRILSYRTPSVGDVVQVKGDTPNRALWKVGKIISLRPGPDGQIRSASVTLENGMIIRRSVGHLYPLEMHVSQEDQPAESSVESHSTPTPSPAVAVPPDTRDPDESYAPTPLATTSKGVPAADASPGARATIDVGTASPMDASSQSTRPRRAAAHRARQTIRQWVSNMFSLAVSVVHCQ